MRNILLSILCLIFSQASLAAHDARNRVEELFIWKISDEMKLSVPDEKAFSDLIRRLNQKRSETNDKLQENLRRMAEAKTTKEKERLLTEQRKVLKAYNEISIEEFDQIQKIFNPDKAAQYFVLKNDLTNKLKALVAAPEKPSSTPMAPPKVIEEQ